MTLPQQQGLVPSFLVVQKFSFKFSSEAWTDTQICCVSPLSFSQSQVSHSQKGIPNGLPPFPLKTEKKIMSTILLAQKKLNYMHNPVLLRDTKKCTYLKIKQSLSLIQHLKGKIFGMLALMRCLFSFVKLTFWCELSQCLDGKHRQRVRKGDPGIPHTRT